MKNDEYYLGFDIGTNSVGWAVTDLEYNLKRFKGNLMWGVNLFDEAHSAAERRAFRSTRRRVNRRKQRIVLLQELFAPEILKVDEKFFLRLKESALFPEDAKNRKHNIFFDDENYNDKKYFRDYPTIHHLIVELMEDDQPHDVRLVYLACAHLLKRRGHFLIDVDPDNIEAVRDFGKLYENFRAWFESVAEIEIPFECETTKFEEVMKKKTGIAAKEKMFNKLLFGGSVPVQDKDEEYPINVSKVIKLLCGGTAKLSDVFKNESYKDLEKNSICVGAADFAESLEELYAQLDFGEGELLSIIKSMYDWFLLEEILTGDKGESKWISQVKVAVYKEHQEDLMKLKKYVKKYLTTEKYDEIFREAGDCNNYVTYSKNMKFVKKGKFYKKKCSQEEFNKFLEKYIEEITPLPEDEQDFLIVKRKIEERKLCPKQVVGDNRIIPYQLYFSELKLILCNAEKYLPFLRNVDEYGTVTDKILSIMQFRIPYYVGPLVKTNDKKCHAWIERKAEGRIYPWNFEDMVDLEESENKFIQRMVGKCTYIAGEEVLPKNSLLYSKFCVLNELNNLAIDGTRISPALKQKIYMELFLEKKAKVSKKKIRDYLLSQGDLTTEQELSGVDDVLNSTLKSHHDFARLLTKKVLNEQDVERIIERITATTDRKRLKRWLHDNFPVLDDNDLLYIAKLSYKDYGRLSRKLLEEVTDSDEKTKDGAGNTIISMLWESQYNLMQLLSEQFGFARRIEALNSVYYSGRPEGISERLENMYLSAAVRRPIIRTIEIAKEIKSILKYPPKKIFIETTRGNIDKGKKGKRTKSRKEQLSEFLAIAREFSLEENDRLDYLESQLGRFDEGQLRSTKYYLYFKQLGRCMYSWKTINIEQILDEAIYNIDHIFPQAKVKDDSIDNKVLVRSELNAEKGDKYPIEGKIRIPRYSDWKALREKNLISEKKFVRLTRSEPFSNDELFGFINRQLVETSQASKAVAQLLKEMFCDSDIVYVKAGLVSEFRHEYDMLKCREINDSHHAKDAYLNIVMGNVHDVKFTKNPMNIVLHEENYSMKLKTILNNDIKRNNVVAWDAKTSFGIVRRNMDKNSVRYVKYTYKRKGEFYDQNPERARQGLAEIKKGLDTRKYGGYNNMTATYFSLVKCGTSICVMPVELLFAEKFEKDKDFAKNYTSKMMSMILSKTVVKEDVSFPLCDRIIKIGTLIEVDGCRLNIVQKSNGGRTLVVALADSAIVEKKHCDYIKRLAGFADKSENGRRFKATESDKISVKENLLLFDLLCGKYSKRPFVVLPILEKLRLKIMNGRERFLALAMEEQILVLLQMVHLIKTGRSSGCNLKLLDESGQAGVLTINSTLNKIKGIKEIRIIDQSPTGLFEKRSVNLMEL